MLQRKTLVLLFCLTSFLIPSLYHNVQLLVLPLQSSLSLSHHPTLRSDWITFIFHKLPVCHLLRIECMAEDSKMQTNKQMNNRAPMSTTCLSSSDETHGLSQPWHAIGSQATEKGQHNDTEQTNGEKNSYLIFVSDWHMQTFIVLSSLCCCPCDHRNLHIAVLSVKTAIKKVRACTFKTAISPTPLKTT